MEIAKETVVELLDKFNRQRPGLEYGNYGDPVSYRAELRGIARDKREADRLLCAVAQSQGMPVETLMEGFRAFSGRLKIERAPEGGDKNSRRNSVDGWQLDYCTGQYFPTEYRRAVAAVLAAALWDYHRDDYAAAAKPGESAQRGCVCYLMRDSDRPNSWDGIPCE